MLAVIAVPSAHAERFQKGFWGPTEIDGKSQFPIYRDLRVTLFQMSISWATVAPTRPRHARDPRDRAYIWPPEIDDAIRQAKRYHMRVLLMLTNAPSWANSGRTPEYAPDRPSDFAAFARAAARRYPPCATG